jgi:hypothetical protein
VPERRPLVLIDGRKKELPTGDTVAGATGGGGVVVGFEIDGGDASTDYDGLPSFDFGSAMAYAKLQLRGDTAADWAADNPTLSAREFGLETDTGKFKIGDGVTDWNSLAYGGVVGPGVPVGGTVGQMLAKVSGTDYDTEWTDAPTGGGGGIEWTSVSTDTTMVADTGYAVSGAHTMTLPATIAAGDLFPVHASDAAVSISTSYTITYGTQTVCSSGDTLTLAAGETVYLLAKSTSALEII